MLEKVKNVMILVKVLVIKVLSQKSDNYLVINIFDFHIFFGIILIK